MTYTTAKHQDWILPAMQFLESYILITISNERIKLMTLKKWFWNGGEEDSLSEIQTEGESESRPIQRPATTSKSTNPLAALRTGPTASIFTRAVGMPVTTSSLSTNHVAVDTEFDKVIAGALEQDAKAPGFKEFMAQVGALSAIISDRGQCVKAALAAVTAINPSLNATVVAKSIGERLQLLSGYRASYDTDSCKAEENETADKRSSISEIETRMREIDTEIQRLAGERAQCENQKGKLESEMQGVGSKYDGYRTRFNGTIEARCNELKNLLTAVAPSAPGKES